jgi:hypothetical protein
MSGRTKRSESKTTPLRSCSSASTWQWWCGAWGQPWRVHCEPCGRGVASSASAPHTPRERAAASRCADGSRAVPRRRAARTQHGNCCTRRRQCWPCWQPCWTPRWPLPSHCSGRRHSVRRRVRRRVRRHVRRRWERRRAPRRPAGGPRSSALTHWRSARCARHLEHTSTCTVESARAISVREECMDAVESAGTSTSMSMRDEHVTLVGSALGGRVAQGVVHAG